MVLFVITPPAISGGDGDMTGPTGETGLESELLMMLATRSSSSLRRCSSPTIKDQRSSGRSLRPEEIFCMSSTIASAAVKDGEAALEVEDAKVPMRSRAKWRWFGLRWACRAKVVCVNMKRKHSNTLKRGILEVMMLGYGATGLLDDVYFTYLHRCSRIYVNTHVGG